MRLSGELGEGILPGVLRTVYVERRTGMLHVIRAGERASICFIEGNIVHGSTSVKEARFGETLVRHGLLTEWDQARAAEMVEATGRRFGQILLDLGILDAGRLEEGLAVHVRELLLTIFCWRDGRYEFEEQDRSRFRGYDGPLRLSTGEVILDAVWSIADPDVIRFWLGDLDRVLAPATDPLLRFQRLNLNETDGFLLSRVDGVLMARQILDQAPVTPEEAQRSLLGLIYTGMVEYLPARPKGEASGLDLARQILEAWAALPRQSHYEVLAVGPDARSAEILAAFFRLARLYHPDAHHQPGLEHLKAKLEALFARVTEAHRVLSNPALRAAYDEASAARVAEAATESAAAAAEPDAPARDPESVTRILNEADQALERGEPARAMALASDALRSAVGSARRRGRLLKVRALMRDESTRKTGEEELKKNLEEDPGDAEAHVLLGTIHKEGGAAAQAAACFRRAVALRPRHPEALAELAALDAKPRGEGGVLAKLFK